MTLTLGSSLGSLLDYFKLYLTKAMKLGHFVKMGF